jgi:ribosomal protein S18 acetylase RimI-like enzyme
MMIIREAKVGDADAIYSLGRQVPEFVVNGDDTVTFWPKDILENALTSDDTVIFIASDQDKVVGFTIAAYNQGLKKATIENMYVAPDHRQSGVGKLLIERLLSTLASKGCEYVATLVPPNTDAAIRFYQSAGLSKGETFLWMDRSLSDNFKRA